MKIIPTAATIAEAVGMKRKLTGLQPLDKRHAQARLVGRNHLTIH